MNAAVEMTPDWKRWEGDVVSNEFPLEQFLGAGEQGAVFRTRLASGAGAIKLVPAPRAQAEELVERWDRASRLDHPHLLRILKTGTWLKAGIPVAYVVMEYAEENLGAVLAERALTAEETLEMLQPAAEALAFLHGRGYAHGRLRPSNIFAVNDTVKLSSDAVSSGDTWADLGAVAATTIQVLTRKPVSASDSDSDTSVVEGLPPVFQEIVRNCAGRNGRRWSAAQLEDWLRSHLISGVGQDSTHASSLAATPGSTSRLSPAISTAPTRVGRPKAGKSKVTYYAVVFGLILVAVVTVGSILSHRTPDSVTPAPTTTAKASEPAPVATPLTPSPAPSRTASERRAKAAKPSTTPATTPATTPTTTPSEPAAKRESAPPTTDHAVATDPAASGDAAVATPPAPRRVVGASGDVVHEVIPEFTAKARRTVHGTVNVVVRVVADQSGHVTDAALESKGSPYFGKLLLQAARGWQFVAGNSADPREWFLRYQITRTDSKVFVEKSR
jgi:outer membrane biosynthesis protein TonB